MALVAVIPHILKQSLPRLGVLSDRQRFDELIEGMNVNESLECTGLKAETAKWRDLGK